MELDQILYATTIADIKAFNDTRGRRKGLNPIFIKHSEIKIPYRKYKRIIECEEREDAFDAVQRVAHCIVPTLLRRKPRPEKINLDILEYAPFIKSPSMQDEPRKLLVRLVVLKDGNNSH